MALRNRDRIGRAFETLARGLEPFVDRQMYASPAAGPDWFDRFFRREGRSASKSDPYVLLRAMTDHWEVFRRDRAKEELLSYGAPTRGRPRRTQRTPTTGLHILGLPSWREAALPRVEVATGHFAEAEFAADLAQVHRGNGGPEYADPVEFFRRTFLTQGLQALLTQALRRLSRDPRGIPVIGLQTNFGGGKTHSLLSLYHLLSGRELAAFPNEGVRDAPCARTLTGTRP